MTGVQTCALPICGTLETGPAIEWSRDYAHGVAYPAVWFRRIPYLDFARVGDHKAIWELNRHQHLVTLAQAWLNRTPKSGEAFVERGQLKLVMAVLLPAAAYVLVIQWFGIYAASAIYMAVFMVWLGKYAWWKAALLGIAVSVAVFLMFEVWFKVPLHKGTLYNPLALFGF